MTAIHPTSSIHPTAVLTGDVYLGANTVIGPHCHIGGRGNGVVRIGDGTELISHVVVDGGTQIGDDCQIYPFTALGCAPQHLLDKGEGTKLIIGNRNIIRESVTIHRGIEAGHGATEIGNNGYFMFGSHIGHDCMVGDHVMVMNSAQVGGHVSIGDHAVISGVSAIHQYVRIGKYAMIAAGAIVLQDMLPYCLNRRETNDRDDIFSDSSDTTNDSADTNRSSNSGQRRRKIRANVRGLKKHRFSKEQIQNITNAIFLAMGSKDDKSSLPERVEIIRREYGDVKEIGLLIEFLSQESKFGILGVRNSKRKA